MSDLSKLTARVESLEKAVQSLLGAVKIMETMREGGMKKTPAKKAGKSAAKKHAPAKKRVEKS